MTAAIRLSRKAAVRIFSALSLYKTSVDACSLGELERALTPRPKSSQRKKTARATSLAVRAARFADKAMETATIYAAVERRAGGFCESCGRAFVESDPPQMDHQLKRAKARQSVSNCWMIHAFSCHEMRTQNMPSAAHWWEKIRAHAIANGHWDTARAAGKNLRWTNSKRELLQRAEAGR